MAKKVHIRPYAQAVFEIALKANALEQWQADLQKIASAVGDAALMAWLENPKIRFEDKVRLVSERLPGINPLALNLVRLLIAKGKPGIIGDIANEYQRLLDSHHGVEQAEVITAIPLSEEDKQKLAEKLGAIIGKKILLKPRVDPGVIGGIVARIDGKLLDASTHSKLEALRKELAGAAGKR